jgi:hypothetical protein
MVILCWVGVILTTYHKSNNYKLFFDTTNILAKYLEPILARKYDINMDTNLATGCSATTVVNSRTYPFVAKNEIPKRERAKKAFMLECRNIKEALSSNDEV